ncbi:branched-chain amino acid aminotransferase [Paenarthrobacter sp. NPDC090520]|uniref:branched-chain amino acid aminotransferase n=1 Tax=unclassified Paenarthrobacter TaxID=2634190 RepID=UPI0037FE683F
MPEPTSNALQFTRTPATDPTPTAERQKILEDPGFGDHFTDHMVSIHYSPGTGWHDGHVNPYGPLQLDPSAGVFHYGQEIFEGLKAYRHQDGSIWSFRPEENAARFQRSARRMVMPDLPVGLFLDSLKELISVDGAWVPSAPGTSLYLRPFMFAAEAFLGVRSSMEYAYHLIASPAGAYFTGGVKPVSIWLSEQWTRAGKGGTGAAKTGGNYAAGLLPQAEAYDNGCAQVLFLDSVEGRYVEELGGMNVVLVRKDGSLLTPASDTILEGITLKSVLQLAKDAGREVEQRPVTLQEWRDGVASGDIVEMFACGTAAAITPIGELKSASFTAGDITAPPGEVTMELRQHIADIQYGHAADRHGWMLRLDA